MKHVVFAQLGCVVSPSSVGLLGYQLARVGFLGYLIISVPGMALNFFTMHLIVSPLTQLRV